MMLQINWQVEDCSQIIQRIYYSGELHPQVLGLLRQTYQSRFRFIGGIHFLLKLIPIDIHQRGSLKVPHWSKFLKSINSSYTSTSGIVLAFKNGRKFKISTDYLNKTTLRHQEASTIIQKV